MKSSWRRAIASERGTSLAETMVGAAIVGLIVLMLAPVESFLLRRLRESRSMQARSCDVALSATLLSDDVRGARSVTVDGPHGLTVVTPGGVEVVWILDDDGLRRQVRSDGTEVAAARCFSGVMDLRVSRLRPNLLSITLQDDGARRHTVDLCLRNARSLP